VNHSGESVGMSPEGGERQRNEALLVRLLWEGPQDIFWEGPQDTCERCGATLHPGDWPWCRGNPEDHIR
jgi:hypothetical protein